MGATVAYETFGRVGGAIGITPNSGGYQLTLNQNNSTQYGFAWMGFVWINQLSSSMQAVIWSEGYDPASSRYLAGFAVAIGSTGTVTASIGHNGSWTQHLTSHNRIGPKAWHHVALVWDTTRYYLLIDGIMQSSVASSVPPDESQQVPITIGSYYAAGTPRFLLNGSVDEIKFIKFSPGAFLAQGDAPPPGSPGNFVLNEAGLQFRKTVLSDMAARSILPPNGADFFASPTLAATSTLRALVNSFFTTAMTSQPLEPFARWGYSVENYVFPLTGYDPLGNSPPSSDYSLYVRMRDRITYGYCEAAAITLWGLYKSFGFAARKYDWMSGPNDFQYTASHALTEVYVFDPSLGLSQYVMQDPLYNVSGRDNRASPPTYDGVLALYGLQINPPASNPFNDNGYNFNTSPIVVAPLAAAPYLLYFNSPTSIYSSWSQ